MRITGIFGPLAEHTGVQLGRIIGGPEQMLLMFVDKGKFL